MRFSSSLSFCFVAFFSSSLALALDVLLMFDATNAKTKTAVDIPNVAEMVECVKKLGIVYMLEDKSHPKSPFMRARIRVRLFEADQKTPIKPEVAKSSKSIQAPFLQFALLPSFFCFFTNERASEPVLLGYARGTI